MNIFSPDGALYKFISRLWDVIVLNFLWLLFSIPIITIGASTVAVYSVCLKMVDDEECYIARSFVKAFKQNLRQGVILGIITIAACYVAYLNFALFNIIESNPLPLLIMGIIGTVVFVLSLLYAYPLMARYENTIVKTLKNSFDISVKFFGRTIVLLLMVALELFIIFYNHFFMTIGLVIGPIFIMFTIASFAKRIFQQIEREQKEQ